MPRPTTLPAPWRSLAAALGGAEPLYAATMAATGCSLSTAKRIVRGTGRLTFAEFCAVLALFRKHKLPPPEVIP